MTIRFEFLADYQEALPTISGWYHDEWGYEEPEAELADVSDQIVRKYLNNREIPLIICGIEDNELLGVCQLKFREMKMFPDYEHWLGGVYTSPVHRGRGVAERVVKKSISVAAETGVESLYLQTEDLTGGLYKRLGWEPVDQVNEKGREVLVMCLSISS